MRGYMKTLEAVARLKRDQGALQAIRKSINDIKKGRTLKLSVVPKISKILHAARKKGLLRG